MHILFVLHGFPPETSGGTERATEALARAMQAAGHRVSVAAGSLGLGRPDQIGEDDLDGLPVFRMHRDDLYHDTWFKAHHPAVSTAFAALLQRLQPDLVHVQHWIRLTSDLVRVAKLAGCATAVTLHDYFTMLATPVRAVGDDEPAPPPTPGYVSTVEAEEAFALHRRDFAAEIAAADLRCAPTQSHADGLRAMATTEVGHIEVAPPPLLQVPRRRSAEGGTRRRRLVTWGSWYPAKGLEVVLEALRRVGGAFELDVFGEAHEPGHRAALEELARDLPVRWRGPFRLADLEQIDADYAVLPSRCHESYGLALDEAMLLGLPVLASDLPAYRERAAADSCRLFAPGDAAALAALLRDEPGLQSLVAPDPAPPNGPARAAEHLLELYGRARAGSLPGAPVAPPVTDRERYAALFRRAEWRLWTALQQPHPPPPPPSLLGPA
ncbi:MAG: glycosyltransferase [Planctomycetota bacterium]